MVRRRRLQGLGGFPGKIQIWSKALLYLLQYILLSNLLDRFSLDFFPRHEYIHAGSSSGNSIEWAQPKKAPILVNKNVKMWSSQDHLLCNTLTPQFEFSRVILPTLFQSMFDRCVKLHQALYADGKNIRFFPFPLRRATTGGRAFSRATTGGRAFSVPLLYS